MTFGRLLSPAVAVLAAITLVGPSKGQTADKPVAGQIGATPSSQISITIAEPPHGFNVLPGSVRRIFATVANGKTNGVSWSASGGATLSADSGNWVDVTAPPVGSHCSIQGTGPFTVSSDKHFTVTAQSREDEKQSASITVNVCNPAAQVHVVPFYTTLYAGQSADMQAFVWGTVNRDVTWAMTAQPKKGDGVLTDHTNQDTVFSATVAGRYTLTATSVADQSKQNTATIYVTGHSMPYRVTPAKTMPVDCTVDPALTGKTYEVGPSQAYKTIQDVPWELLGSGSTVRIHNEDTTGSSPTTYHEYFQVATHAERKQPVRVCGVPDANGNLPVVDANGSSGRSTVNKYSAGYTAVGIGKPGWAGLYDGNWGGSQYLIVEGLKIENAKQPNTYTTPQDKAPAVWIAFSSCLRLFAALDVVVRGIDGDNCGLGIFSDFGAGHGYAAVIDTLYEGNHLHHNGVPHSFTEHQFYIQGWNEVVQFNLLDDYQIGSSGSNLKGRGFPEVIRYNHFGDGVARQIDLVDNEDSKAYSEFETYLGTGGVSYRSIYHNDTYTADLLAEAVEAHHGDYVYGNTFVNSKAGVPIHYSADHGSVESNRLGTLWFYNNSFYEQVCDGCGNWRWSLFDTAGGGGNDFRAIEWPQIQVLDNAIWLGSPIKPHFSWNNETNQFTIFGRNVINSNWGTRSMVGGDNTGWSGRTSPQAFQGASNEADITGVSNLIGVQTPPFDLTTFAPTPALVNKGAPLPEYWPKLPVRFEFGPSGIQQIRQQPLTIGAME